MLLAGLCLVSALSIMVTHDTGVAKDSPERAKNVVLFIGDGMGIAHRDAIQLATVGLDRRLAMDDLPYSGMSDTKPGDQRTIVTDSAAGGVALASGVKTYNGAIGVDEQTNLVPTVLEQARRAGKATGLVTTDSVTGATPAAFAAHVEDRNQKAEIARQYIEETRPNVILGGGRSYFHQNNEEDASGSIPGNLLKQAQQEGYAYVTNAEELESAGEDKILGLFADKRMFEEGPEGDASYDPAVSLSRMTDKAIATLSRDPDGFFLMVEEEAIDEMSHSNNSELMIAAGQELDKAVQIARNYAKEEPGTLLIVGADHETGGLTVEDVDRPGPQSGSSGEDGPFKIEGSERLFELDWTTNNHTAVDVPITAVGPGAAHLSGMYDNTHVYEVMVESLIFEEASAAPNLGIRIMLSTGAVLLVIAALVVAILRRRALKKSGE